MPVLLLTDFGTRDVYVGVMKGVIVGIAPGTQVIDLCHQVSPQAIDEAAFMLDQALPYLPEGCVVCAVVDPGVGTERRAVAVRAQGRTLVAPDNGLLTPALHGELVAHELTSAAHRLPAPSATFHGRDVFAPAAAHLAAGVDIASLGPALDPRSLVRLESRRDRVVHVDHFGNLVTGLTGTELTGGLTLRIRGVAIPHRVESYGHGEPGELVWYLGSTGRVEVAVVGGSAAERLGASRGAPVELLPVGVDPV